VSHGLFTFDREHRLTKLFWFDSLGYVPQGPASGIWRDDTLILLRPSLRDAARHVYRFAGPTPTSTRSSSRPTTRAGRTC
jgi:hypothetical protein